MQYGHIAGLATPVSRLILGSSPYSTRDMAQTCAALDQFVTLGGNAVDTAHVYGGGDAERAVGMWLRARDKRGQVIVIGKGGHPDEHWVPRIHPMAIASDLGESLERLQTGYIDLYLLHRDDPAVPVGEIVECLNEHLRAGRIRAFGGSNWTPERLAAANAYALQGGLVPFVASSPQFSLAHLHEYPYLGWIAATGAASRQWYTTQQFPLLAWSSQAQGFFGGRYAPDDRSNAAMVQAWHSAENFERLERAKQLGQEKGVPANAIALAFVLCQPFPSFAIVGPRSLEQLTASVGALEIRLSPEELRWLNLDDDREGAPRISDC
jgi:aryl-alcohol dehydrogenase-like predicted oxidoreductase